MATVSLTISSTDLTRIVAALSVRWGYPPFLADGVTPNPQTRGEFVRLHIGQWITQELHAHELATAQAAITAPTDVVIS